MSDANLDNVDLTDSSQCYSFGVFEKANIEPTATAIVFGVRSGLLPVTSVADFEEWLVTNRGIDGSSELLVFDGSREEALAALEKESHVDNGTGEDILRYAVLASLESHGHDLLDDIEKVYADFGYPEVMEPFVYYMPSKEGDLSTEALIKRFKEFLIAERERLGL